MSDRVSVTGRRSLALIVLGVVLALAGLACAYVRRELAEPEAFADRAVEALRARRRADELQMICSRPGPTPTSTIGTSICSAMKSR